MIPARSPSGLAFVDIETTGGPAQRESITEIGVLEVDEDGVREWSTLVRPAMRIPEHIERLTGIDNATVADAPPFAEIADELFDRLHGRLFVAHNARFDHGHIKAAYRRLGVDLRVRVLCTVRLSRALFPEARGHSLDHLIVRHGLEATQRHRALGDARVLLAFWRHLHERFSSSLVEAAIDRVVGRPALPPHIDATLIDAIPERAGVYLFYGENDLPLYVGKSTRLRTRVLSHFSSDHRNDRELSLSQQIRRIDWRETSGEIGALLAEACLVKELQPTHNRQLRRNRELCAWTLNEDLTGLSRPKLARASDPGFGHDTLYGLFRSRRAATESLRALAREHGLCPPLLGLERPQPDGRCFSHQLGQCRGACSGREAPHEHDARLRAALTGLRLERWPHAGPIALEEAGTLHVVDGWRYYGSAPDYDAARHRLERETPAFDLDIYRILVRAVANLPNLSLKSAAAQSTVTTPEPR